MRKHVLLLIVISTMVLSCKPGQEKIDRMLYEAINKIQKSDSKGAIEDLTEIIGYQENNYQAYFYRANANFNLKKAKEALNDYNKAIELKPDYADAFYNRGLCKQYLGDKTGACSDWDKAVVLGKPNVKDMLNNCE
ncbi:MAG: tetratricopeptide repeat protein [Bacteroidota bacterium]